MNRAARLQSAAATSWVKNYRGKNIVRGGYCRWFGVDALCAVVELRALGVPIDAEREQELRNAAESRAKAKAERKRSQKMNQEQAMRDSNGTYQFISGYSPGGVPEGVTWEEAGEDPGLMRDLGEERDWISDGEEGPVAAVRIDSSSADTPDKVPF
jgi:hypothetical protein